jgi:hypothetical protein
VALCTWNGERHLAAQLDSLLAQDYPNLEIVAVDDASSDGTAAILHDYARRDRRITVHRNADRLGHARNFERAIRLTHGALIAPSDQDDVWAPTKLRRLARARGDATLVYCDSLFIDDQGRSHGRRVSDHFHMYQGGDPRVFAFYNCASGHAMLFSRALLEHALPFPAGHYHDWWLATVAAATGRVAYVDECLVQFRQHARSVTDVSSSKAPQPPGDSRITYIRAQTAWLDAVRRIPGNREAAFFDELHALWTDWQDRYIAPRLVAFLWAHRGVLCALPHAPAGWPGRRPWRMLWGMKLRRLLQPARYDVPVARD